MKTLKEIKESKKSILLYNEDGNLVLTDKNVQTDEIVMEYINKATDADIIEVYEDEEILTVVLQINTNTNNENLTYNKRCGMQKLNIYTIGKKNLIWSGNVKNVYDSSFYFRTMPTLSAKRCRQILNKLYPHFKAEKETLIFEWVDNGYTGMQELYRNGTILNF